MYFDKAPNDSAVLIDRPHGVVLGVMAVPVVILGLFWSPLQQWAERSIMMWGN